MLLTKLGQDMEIVLKQGRSADSDLASIRNRAKQLSDQEWWMMLGTPVSAAAVIICLYIGLATLRSSLIKSLKKREKNKD